MYGNEHNDTTINLLKSEGLLKKLEDGREVVELKDQNASDKSPQTVVIRKSDGSSLYITRDIAAAIHRAELFNFDKMFYVVDQAQGVHFSNLITILKYLGYEWAHQLEHVTFGRIKGMNSRKGTAVFLSDILDEGQQKMMEQQNRSINRRVRDGDKHSAEIADILAMSAVICNDLKQRRTKDYEFDWEKVLQSKGDSGIKLQYTHARLTSLITKMNKYEGPYLEHMKASNSFSCLVEPEAINLVYRLATFDEALKDSYFELEPCILLNYLFRLCNETSKALKVLGVKTATSQDTAVERFALFCASRATLRYGMKLLGLRPLDNI